ncbi:MAG TPA: membrane dipeptidase [Chloroflexaceae bacterium]|nr:membrane dipeptidase [Chloroflexaceae bacterium]
MYVDGHLDIAYNVFAGRRDFEAGVAAIRAAEQPPDPCEGTATVGLPDLRRGGVGLVFATLFTLPAAALGAGLAQELVYATPEEAHAQALAQLDYYQGLAARGLARVILTRSDLAAHQAAWPADGCLGIVVLMENADPIVTPAEAAWWVARGVRIVGPAWQGTRYCGGTRQPGPLTPLGRALLPALAAAGAILDVSHMAEESFWQALELWPGPLIASHSNCRALVAERLADRHLSDAMIRALVERGAVVGAVFYNAFLAAGYSRGDPKDAYGLEVLVRHIDRVCQIAGDARHAAIGSDLDGGLGREHIPRELDSVADMPRLAEALAAHGYADPDVAAIMGGNWLRVLDQGLPE